MTNGDNIKPGTRLKHRLISFVSNPDEDIQSMSNDDIKEYLHYEGIDMTGKYRVLASKLDAIKGQQRLAAAREKKGAFSERLSHLVAKPGEIVTDIREALSRQLAALNARDPQAALAYFRKLDGATEEDMRGMLDDLQLLDELPAEDGEE